MKPQQFKSIRESFSLTQAQLAECLGLTQKTVSHYEVGFRMPGPTVQVVMTALSRMKPNQSRLLLDFLKEAADDLKMSKKKRASS